MLYFSRKEALSHIQELPQTKRASFGFFFFLSAVPDSTDFHFISGRGGSSGSSGNTGGGDGGMTYNTGSSSGE